jgi:transposase
MEAHDARKLSPAALQELRYRAVRAVVEQGLAVTDACRTFGVGRTALHSWLSAYRDGGQAALKLKRRGRRPQPRLKGHQAATIVRLITDRCPDQLKLPFALRTREAVARLIERRVGLKPSVWTAGRLLTRWGFTPQKPVRRAYERDPAAVKRWLEGTYPTIRREAGRESAEIHWGDEMGLRSDHQSGTSYSPRGKTPVVPGTGQRFGCNMISTVTNRGKLAFMVFRERFTAEVFVRFLRRLVRQSPRKVDLIVAGHPVHRSREVAAWVQRHADRIRLFRLPGYSPDLNPDELLNHDVKSNALGRRRPSTRVEMEEDVRGYLRATQRRPQVVRNYFRHPLVAYAAT